jgi:hypothetical protein
VFGTKEDGLFVSAFDFDTVSFDVGIVFEGLVNNAAIEGAERLEFDDVAPTANFFRGVFGFFDEGFTGLSAVTADVHHNFRRGRVLLKEEAVGDVLEVGKSLALASDETAGVVGFDVEQNAFAFFHVVLLDGDGEAEELEHFFESGFGFGGHLRRLIVEVESWELNR